MIQIVGFGHRRRVGKDQISKFIDTLLKIEQPKLKVIKVSFAAKLKETTFELYKWAGLERGVFYESEQGAKLKELVLPAIGMSPREIWIKVGNKLREVYADTWIDCALKNFPNADVILVTDVRFPNEVAKIQIMGGRVYKIIRPGEPMSDDASDSALDGFTAWDGYIENDSDLAALHLKADALAREILNATQR
jgi:hypothetical protein